MFMKRSSILGVTVACLLGTTAHANEAKWVNFTGKQPENVVKFYHDDRSPDMSVCRTAVPEENHQVYVGIQVRGQCTVKTRGGNRVYPIADGQLLGMKDPSWVAVTGGAVPENAFVAATINNKPMHVCRLKYANEGSAGNVVDGNCNHIRFAGPAKDYEVLVAPAGTTVSEEAIIIPGSAKWVKGITPESVEVGMSARRPMHVCRAKVPNGEMHAGKLWNGNCYIGFGGKELKIALASAEVLSFRNSTWVKAASGKLPEKAYEIGTSNNQPMHVCRGKVPNNEIHGGKLWNGTCYIGFGGNEIKATEYDVLVSKM